MNTLDEDANQSEVRVIWSSLPSTCDTVDCLGERGLFSSLLEGVFLQFFSSFAPIT